MNGIIGHLIKAFSLTQERDILVCTTRREDFLTEPTLPQLLNDPLTRLLMASDGVDPRELRELFAEIAGLRARCAGQTKGTNSP